MSRLTLTYTPSYLLCKVLAKSTSTNDYHKCSRDLLGQASKIIYGMCMEKNLVEQARQLDLAQLAPSLC